MRVSLPRDPIGTRLLGRNTSRKARDRHIEATPEEVHGTDLAKKSPAEPRQDAIHLQQDLPKTPDVFRIVGSMRSILLKRNGVRYLGWHRADSGLEPKKAKPRHNLGVKVSNTPRAKSYRFGLARARLELQNMIDEVKIYLKNLCTVWDR
jgi:hypothetical protein